VRPEQQVPVSEEGQFLMRSLEDLEAERAAGGMDDATYERLHADYTARAAALLRAERGDDTPVPDASPRSTGRRIAVVGGIVVFAAVAAVALAFALGARLPGQTITGGTGEAQVSDTERERALESVVAANPDDPAAHLALARFRMGAGDGSGALTEFQAAAGLDPSNPEPFAYSGWLIRLQGYPDQGLQLLDKALEVDPDYADARFFRAFILLRDLNRPAAAIPDLQQYLVLEPESPLAEQVRTLLAEAVTATQTPTSTTTP
jgi:cytochrome c-type biogenesis protein CcmH/NrfG